MLGQRRRRWTNIETAMGECLVFAGWSLDLFIRVPFQLHREHTVLQPFRRNKLITHIAISVPPGTHFHLCLVKHLKVECLAQGHNIETMSQYWKWRNLIFLWKPCTKRDSKPRSRQRHWQSSALQPLRHVPLCYVECNVYSTSVFRCHVQVARTSK